MEEELDILAARYLDGSASDDEVARLERRLRDDPRGARALFEAAYYDELLRDALAGASVTTAATGNPYMRLVPAFGAEGGADASHDRPVRMPSHWAGLTALAACIVLSMGVFWQAGLRIRGGPSNAAQNGGDLAVPPPAIPRVVQAGPGVRIEHGPAGAFEPADVNAALGIADRIVTGPGASAVVAFERKATRLTLGPDTTLVRTAGAAGMRWDLVAGSLRSEADHQAPTLSQADRPAMVVTTPVARVEAVGLGNGRDVFEVTARGGWTRVQTAQGTVRVTRRDDGATVEVSAGQFVDVGTADPREAPGATSGQDVGGHWVARHTPPVNTPE